MDIEFNLLDEFEYSGTWWLPGKDEEPLSGIIKFKHNYIELELNGVFSKKHHYDLREFDIMLGCLNIGKKVTVYRLSRIYEESSVSNGLNYNNKRGKSIFICEYIFFGNHFLQENDIRFIFLSANFTYLDKWINNKFEYKWDKDEYNIKCKTIDYKMDLESIKSTLHISSIHNSLGDLQTEVEIRYQSNISIQPMDEQSWEWFQKRIIDLGNLLTLLMGYPVYPIKLSAQIKHQPDRNIFDELVNIYYTIPNPRVIEDLHPFMIETTFQDLIRFPNKLVTKDLNNWFKETDIIAPVIDLFFLTFYNPSMNPHIYFLTLMQAIETFHRRVYGGKYLKTGEFKPIRNALINAVPEELIKALTNENGVSITKDELLKKYEYLVKNFQSKISMSNEFSLTTRLKELSNCGRGELKWFKMLIDDEPDGEEKIIQRLVATRNYYTHFDENNRRNSFSDDDLPRINYKLSVFLKVLLIQLIDTSGILGGSDIIYSAVEKSIEYKKLKEFKKGNYRKSIK